MSLLNYVVIFLFLYISLVSFHMHQTDISPPPPCIVTSSPLHHIVVDMLFCYGNHFVRVESLFLCALFLGGMLWFILLGWKAYFCHAVLLWISFCQGGTPIFVCFVLGGMLWFIVVHYAIHLIKSRVVIFYLFRILIKGMVCGFLFMTVIDVMLTSHLLEMSKFFLSCTLKISLLA